MYRFTLDAASEFLFGSCVNALQTTELPYPTTLSPFSQSSPSHNATSELDFSTAFLNAQTAISNRERAGPIWPLGEIWEDKVKAPMKVINEYIEPIVHDALRKRGERDEEKKLLGVVSQGEKDVGEDETLLDHLVEKTLDPHILKDETLVILSSICLICPMADFSSV
jgi:hypothetical protein